jgi:hypothetical protein
MHVDASLVEYVLGDQFANDHTVACVSGQYADLLAGLGQYQLPSGGARVITRQCRQWRGRFLPIPAIGTPATGEPGYNLMTRTGKFAGV